MIDPVLLSFKLSVLRLKWHVGRGDSGTDICVRHTHLVTYTDAMKASLILITWNGFLLLWSSGTNRFYTEDKLHYWW